MFLDSLARDGVLDDVASVRDLLYRWSGSPTTSTSRFACWYVWPTRLKHRYSHGDAELPVRCHVVVPIGRSPLARLRFAKEQSLSTTALVRVDLVKTD